VDAFFERHAIWRAADPHELVSAAALYLSGRRPRGNRLVFISNSGASCVMAADYAEQAGLALAGISSAAKERMRQVLPAFAGLDNPLDVTGALLGNPQLFSAVLPAVGEDAQSDLLLVALPVAGTGYDVPGFARDMLEFSSGYGHAAAVAAPQRAVRAAFEKAGIATFEREREAMDALSQLARHAAMLGKRAAPLGREVVAPPAGGERFLNEAESLAVLAQAGLPVVEHRLCDSEDAVLAACAALGAPVVLKACSRDLPHKSEHGLVALEPGDPAAAFRRQRERIAALGARFEGVLVARRAPPGRELALGARIDPQFGPVVLVGDGGVFLEVLKDYRLLVPPFDESEVVEKLRELRIAPLLEAWRGEAARDVPAFARMARRLGEAIIAWRGSVASVDMNPVMVFETGRGALAVDALIERAV
jgi:acyl-CoA synthetase (NDP forming)